MCARRFSNSTTRVPLDAPMQEISASRKRSRISAEIGSALNSGCWIIHGNPRAGSIRARVVKARAHCASGWSLFFSREAKIDEENA